MTPARLAHLRSVIRAVDERYAPVEFKDGEVYDIGTISVPVRGDDGRVQFILRLSQLSPAASAAQVYAWIGRLTNAAAHIA